MIKQWTWQQFQQLTDEARQVELEQLGQKVLAETAVFQQTSDMLSYHNRLADLIHLLKSGYTQLKQGEPTEWQQQTITALLMDGLLFQYLMRSPADGDTAPPELAAALQAIVPVETEGLTRYLAHLRGYTQYQWQLAHLTDHPPQNMAALMIEFLAFAHKEAGVAYGRTNLVRHLLPTYFVERRTGQLNPRQDFGDLMRSGRPLPKPPASHHPLLPDGGTFQRYLAKLLNYAPERPYAAAALFCLIPIWLAFLQHRQLLTSEEAAAGLADLAPLQQDLLAYYQTLTGDAALETAVSNWPHPA